MTTPRHTKTVLVEFEGYYKEREEREKREKELEKKEVGRWNKEEADGGGGENEIED